MESDYSEPEVILFMLSESLYDRMLLPLITLRIEPTQADTDA